MTAASARQNAAQVWFATDLDREEGDRVAPGGRTGHFAREGQARHVRRDHPRRSSAPPEPALDQHGPRVRAGGAPRPGPHRGLPPGLASGCGRKSPAGSRPGMCRASRCVWSLNVSGPSATSSPMSTGRSRRTSRNADRAAKLGPEWRAVNGRDERYRPRRGRARPAGRRGAIPAELVEAAGESSTSATRATASTSSPSRPGPRHPPDRRARGPATSGSAGGRKGRGPAARHRLRRGGPGAEVRDLLHRDQTHHDASAGAFITSTLQQAASTRWASPAGRCRPRAAGEGVEIPGEAPSASSRTCVPTRRRCRDRPSTWPPHRQGVRRQVPPRSPTSSRRATKMRRRPTRRSAPRAWTTRPAA